MDILIIVDMQNDFIDGALGTKEAKAIVPDVVKKLKTLTVKLFIRETPMKRIIWIHRKAEIFR